MRPIQTKRVLGFVVQAALAVLALASVPAARAENFLPPGLPSGCGSIRAQAGNEVTFHAYALGVQVYRWNGSAWTFVEPRAMLFADAGYRGRVGIHYAGPTWESNSSSSVLGRRVLGTGCTPDPTAIPWLLLEKVSTDGPGIFTAVTFIQRVNTAGGLPPAAPGSTVGEEKGVPYTAEYYFYSAEN
jgi:hypothetical protein